jgi:GT2 family glycosyltransferase
MIPQIIHQIWIGDQAQAPLKWMKTWKAKHPEFEYIFWNEDEIAKRGMTFECQKQIDLIPEINGKADIMRWEILYKYGGVFIDADSICIEHLPLSFLRRSAFASFENEVVRKGLIATGTMGFIPEHPLCRDIINWIRNDQLSEHYIIYTRAWYSVGPARLTEFLNTGRYKDVSIFPSHYFLPIHFTGDVYLGHKKVYAHQAWGTANQLYVKDDAFGLNLPQYLTVPPPENWVSVLIPSYNTEREHIRDCLNSIKAQKGWFGMQVVWVNDGSDLEHTAILEEELLTFESNTRFCSITYLKNLENKGVAWTLNHGLQHCHHEIVVRMDSDDIMFEDRIQKQLDFMLGHEDAVICGTGMEAFNEFGNRSYIVHPDKIGRDELEKEPRLWIANHPTLMMKKSIVLEAGNYDCNAVGYEDLELELRLIRRGYILYNLSEILLYYRIHGKQVSQTNDIANSLIIEPDLTLRDVRKNIQL